MATQAQLVRRTLKLLGAFAAGQEPSAEDVETIEGYIPGRLEKLRVDDIVYVPDVEDIPDAFLNDIATLVAIDASPEFGSGMDAAGIAFATAELRRLNAVRSDARRLRATYY